MTAFTFITAGFFSYRLPGSGPVILRFIIPYVKIASGLVKAVEDITQNPSVCSGFCKAVAAGIVRDDRPVFGGAQIIDPGRGCIGAGDYVFSVLY